MNIISLISKSVFFVSLVLNAILLMYLVGVISFLLYLSILINLFLIWYTYQFVLENKRIEEDINLLFNSTEEFSQHLEGLYELEMYYGDENLHSLIEHSRDLLNQYVDIQEKYYDVEVDVELEEGEDDNEEETSQEE